MKNIILYLNKEGIMEFIIFSIISVFCVIVSNILFYKKTNDTNAAFFAGLAFPFGAYASFIADCDATSGFMIIFIASLSFAITSGKYRLYIILSLIYYISMIVQFILYFSF